MIDDILFLIVLFILFWDAVGLINRWYKLKKRGFTVSPGIIMWRTKRGLNFINRVAQAKRFWRNYGTVAVVFGVILMVFVLVNLLLNFLLMFTRPAAAIAGVQFVLPGIVPGLTLVDWLIAIATVLIVHEFAHGFLLRAQNLKTKSVGGMLFLAIPGAFVEPDEKQLARAPVLKRMRVFAAGAFSNVLFSLLCLAIVLALLVPKPGAYVYAVAKNYPADNHNIGLGMRIYSIDNFQINNPDDFENFMSRTRPYDNVLVLTSAGEKQIMLAKSPDNENRGYLGVALISAVSRWNFLNPLFVLGTAMAELLGSNVFHPYVFDAVVPWAVIDILKWIFVLNIGIGLFNLLPAIPLDGGYLARGILEKIISKDKAITVSKALSVFVLAIILANFIPFLR